MTDTLLTQEAANARNVQWWHALTSPVVQLAVPPGATALVIPLRLQSGEKPYGVQVATSWLTTVAVPVATRLKTGVTIQFATAAPAGAVVDCIFYRATRGL